MAKKDEKKKKSLRLRTPKWLKSLGRVFIIFKPLRFLLWPFRPFGRYVKGAWAELRQVKWPSHKTSLKLTGAVIIFTAVLTGFIVAIDYGFEKLVKGILL